MLEKDLQQQLDIQKWSESEKQCMDMCRNMPYCNFCKGEAENPCAKAYIRQTEANAKCAESVAPTAKAPSAKVAKAPAAKAPAAKAPAAKAKAAPVAKAPAKKSAKK